MFIEVDGIGPMRSIREFDQKIVARYCGFRDADDYYYRAASARVIDGIAVPTLILCARTIHLSASSRKPARGILANPHITFVETRHGGHCAFLSRRSGDGIHWAEAAVVRLPASCRRGHAATRLRLPHRPLHR